MWSALAGLPNKINKLLGRVTDTRAENLDKLDATVSSRMPGSAAETARIDANISSRAPASTALTNTVWSDTRAGYVDVEISSRAPASTALSTVNWTNIRAGYLDRVDANISSRAPASTALSTVNWTNTRAGYLDRLPLLDPLNMAPMASGIRPMMTPYEFATSSGAYPRTLANQFDYTAASTDGTHTIIDITGKGVINFLDIHLQVDGNGNGSSNVSWVLEIDGVEAASGSIPSVISASRGRYVAIIGRQFWGTPSGIVLDQVPFHSSCVLTLTNSNMSSSTKVYVHHLYRLVA